VVDHHTLLWHAPTIFAAAAAACRGQATTLKRNGSDFSATILGALFRSGHITIWTDVDGVYSADPRKVRAQGRPTCL
jgi:aspartokinase